MTNSLPGLGAEWAQQLIVSEKRMVWLFLPFGYLVFALRTLFLPLTRFQKVLKINPPAFWFALGIALVLLITWLR